MRSKIWYELLKCTIFFKHVLSVIKPKKCSLYVFNGRKYKIIINDDC